MKNEMFTHNMQSQIIGGIEYNEPFQYTFVYADNRRHQFDNIMRLVCMKTGCYVLIDKVGCAFVVRPTHDYIIEKPMEDAK